VDRYQLAARIIEVLEEPLAGQGFALLDVRIFRGGGRLTLRVYVDTENGVSVDDCARASRTVGMLLEEADLMRDAYLIEVTSPGVRRPLRTEDHLRDAVGQDVILKIADGKGTRTLKGRLLSAGDGGLVLETAAAGAPDAPAPLRLGLDEIREANLDPEFDVQALINADRRRRKQDRKLAREKRREQKRRPHRG
jgi:ribosome maturation factor RimP